MRSLAYIQIYVEMDVCADDSLGKQPTALLTDGDLRTELCAAQK